MSMTDKQRKLADVYIEAIHDKLGLLTEDKIDDDGDLIISFKYPDVGSFFILLDAEKDPEFMRLIYPNFYSSRDAASVLATINKVNVKCKAVKLWAHERNGEMSVSAGIESFLAGTDQSPTAEILKSTLKRCIDAVRSGLTVFAKEIGGVI